MTSHEIAVAKASFSAGLLRPDPVSVPRDDIVYFHDALDRTLAHCSPANIQTCKSWILQNVVSSAKRVGVLGKYLAALADSFRPGGEQSQSTDLSLKSRKASSKRRRLHILYLLNDLLHHTKYHGENPAAFLTFSSGLQPYLVELFELSAGYDCVRNPKHYRRVNELLDIWGDNGYYSADYVDKLRQTVEHAASPDTVNAKSVTKEHASEPDKKIVPKDPPFVMPASHGDPGLLWHELPAGNLMPLIIPNSSAPIHTQSVNPLKFLAGPADETLVGAVKTLLKDVDRIYNTSGGIGDGEALEDVDEMGQIIIRDETTGEMIEGDAYYGWSLPFCQKMKQRRDGKHWSRSPSRDRSRSLSSSPRKRRRYSDSDSDDEGRSRPRMGASSTDRYYRRRSTSRSRSRVGVRRSQSRSKSYFPHPPSPSPPRAPQFQQSSYAANPTPPPPPPPPPQPMQYPYHGAPQFTPPQQQTGSPGMFATPPPRPPNYNGPWPPPPPPMPPQYPAQGTGFPQNMNVNRGIGMNMNAPGFAAPFPHPNGVQHFMPSPGPPLPHIPSPVSTHDSPAPYQMSASPPNHDTHQSYNRGGRGGARGGWGRGG